MKILIVDDNAANLKLLRAQLEAEGYTVIEAHDGLEALAMLDKQPVDAVISDILMPRMDGYRFCYKVRNSDQFHKLPFVFYTSTYLSPGDEKMALDLGADRYLRKPASTADLLGAVKETVATPGRPPVAQLAESDMLREYSEQLVKKLEEKNAELFATVERLQASEERLRTILQTEPECVKIISREGRLVEMNPAGLAMLEADSLEDVCRRPLQDFLAPRDRAAFLQLNQRVMNGETGTLEYEVIGLKGTRRRLETHATPLRNKQGDIVSLLGITRDITERKQAQLQLLRMQRAETVGRLAAGVAHDLNNALAPVLMATELLRMDYPETSSSVFLEMIKDGATRGADMVKQLLTFAKGSEGERLLLHPRRICREMEELIKRTFPVKIELKTNYADRLQNVLGDATQLHQVLLNLCINARDAMPDGGTLTLKAENINFDAASTGAIPEARPGSYVAISVMDTGSGIPPETLEHIFEPFFSTKGPHKGTGLGLSTVVGIVRSHGGFVLVWSTPQQGSTFTVYLPGAGTADNSANSQPKAQADFRGNGETILVVDDETPVRNVIRSVLTGLNFKVLTASDGVAALAHVSENEGGLRAVITDCQMPNMDGLALARVLKARLPEAGIILSSGQMEEGLIADFNRLGINIILDKPFTQEQLVNALKKVFSS